jgi:predicted transcriptional regulator YdeE
MNLSKNPDVINWPSTHYVCIEKIGPFMETARQAWGELHQGLESIQKNNKTAAFLSLYQMKPEMVYRAGVSVETKPEKLPDGFKYVHFKGGKYSRFVLKGSYSQLPEACGRVFEMVKELKIPVRADFYIENYMNDPKITPEAELITEILIPTE